MRTTQVVICIAALTMLLFPNLSGWSAEDMFIVIHDAASVDKILPDLTNGAGTATKETKDVYKEDADGKTAIKVTGEGGDGQKFNPNIPKWNLEIKKSPGKGEYRYITFAWKKKGGTGIQLQLHATTNTWGHRYHAGANEKNWNPSIQVSKDIPKDWEIHTQDLFTDWGEMTITGIAFTAWSLDYGLWDHVVFHQTKDDPLAVKAVEPQDKLPVTWGKLKKLQY